MAAGWKNVGNPDIGKSRMNWYKNRVKPKLELIEGWARNGMTMKQIAINLGIGETTLDGYWRKHPELEEALVRGKQDAEVLVENALFKKAVGYKYKEVTKERKRNEEGQIEFVTTKAVQKHVSPDVNAAIYWLENRAPKRWAKEKWRKDLEEAKLALLEKKLALIAKDFGYTEDDSDDGFIEALKAAAKEAWSDDNA